MGLEFILVVNVNCYFVFKRFLVKFLGWKGRGIYYFGLVSIFFFYYYLFYEFIYGLLDKVLFYVMFCVRCLGVYSSE